MNPQKIISLATTLNEQTLTPGVPDVDYGAALVRMILSLAICIGLLILTVWFLRRMMHTKYQNSSKNQSIQILEKRMISPKSTLYLVEVDGKKVLLAESQLEIRRIYNFPEFHLERLSQEQDSSLPKDS